MITITGLIVGLLEEGPSFVRMTAADGALVARTLHGLDLLPSEAANFKQDQRITLTLADANETSIATAIPDHASTRAGRAAKRAKPVSAMKAKSYATSQRKPARKGRR